jgi:probable HAF family extracellular repeat protein
MSIGKHLGILVLAVGVWQGLGAPAPAAQSYSIEDLNIEDAVKAVGPNVSGHAAVRSGFTAARSFSKKLGVPVDDLGVLSRAPGTGGDSLGLLRSGDHTTANGINDLGVVVGSTNMSFGSRPCRDDIPGLPPPGNCPISATRAVIWTKSGALRDLGTLPGDSASQAFGINNLGTVVGVSSGPAGTRAFLSTSEGVMQNLEALPGGDFSKALGINDNRQIVGSSGSPIGSRAVRWDPTNGIQDLGVLPGDTSSEAFAINNRGDVLGYSKGPAGTRSFVWSSDKGMQILSPLPGGTITRARSLNETGQVVGSSESATGTRAVVWNDPSTAEDLNRFAVMPPGVTLLSAVGINARGQILALAGDDTDHHGDHEGSSRAFLLTP